MVRKKGLGRGLSALIAEDAKPLEEEILNAMQTLPLEKIKVNENQPRKEFDERKLEELSLSIQKYGVLQPLVVRKLKDGYYEIVAGERRYRASKRAGLKEVPVVLRQGDPEDDAILSIVENVQREDLSPLEEGIAYKQILEDRKLTQQELANALGKSRPYIANMVRLLQLDQDSLQALQERKITSSQARTLLSEENLEKRKEYLQLFIEGKMNVKKLEKKKSKKTTNKDVFLMDLEERLGESLATKVSIIKKRKSYQVQIDCFSNEDLQRLIDRLGASK